MLKNVNMLCSFLIFSFLISKVFLFPLSLNETFKGYLHNQSYAYFSLTIHESDIKKYDYLLVEARRNEDQDLLDNIFSDPNLYISIKHSEPGPNKNEWSSSRFGDEIISINNIETYTNQIFYISIYCQFSCNYILKANLHKTHKMEANKLYTISMTEMDKIKLSFNSKKNYEKMKVNCISFRMRPFRIFLSKEDPSSSNTMPSRPIFINGYYFLIQKGDIYYGTNKEYHVLIENKEYKQDLLFWISYDNEETKINELSPLFGVADENNENCYTFTIERQYLNKNLVISTTLFNGNGYIKIGGWEKVKDSKIKFGEDAYEIVSDKSILLTEKNFKKYGNISSIFNKDLHFCFFAKEETSYLIKIYYQEHSEEAQKLNYLLPGIRAEEMLPNNTLTKYDLLYFEQNKDIKINLKIKRGNAKLYSFFSYEENPYLNRASFEEKLKGKNIIKSSLLSYQTYEIKIEKSDNLCLIEPSKNNSDCKLYSIVDCDSDIDCLYELFFDHIGGITYMKPKVLYSNVITQKEIDLYEVHITDPSIQNFAVILTQNTGITKLKLGKFLSSRGNLNFGDSEKYNKEYIPNVIEIKLEDFPQENLIGTFQFEVEGSAFSSYEIYYYTFDNTQEQLDHKKICMTLLKGKMIQDYIKLNHLVKVYSYDNSETRKGEKNDLFIYFSQGIYNRYFFYIFKDLDDYYYENDQVKGYIWKSGYYNYIHISKDDPDYIQGNIYIMAFINRYNNYETENDITYREKNIESPFSLVITDENTPITLIEGVEFKHPLISSKPKQIFYYNHFSKDNDFIMNINAPSSKIKLGLKVGEKAIIYEKIVVNNYYIRISTKDLNTYWPSEKSCIIEITVEAVNYYEQDFDVTLICKSSENSVVQLNNNGYIDKRKITHQEKQYFVFDANPLENYDIKINSITTYGSVKLFAKKANSNIIPEPVKFPDENGYEFSNLQSLEKEITTLTIPYKDIKDHLPCKILLTVQGYLSSFYYLQGEYSLSISNMVDDIFPNRNYKLMISKDEIKYYHFNIKGNKKRLSISMTNKQVDAYMYLNYGTMNNDISKFQWRSEGNYNEYIDISIDDSFFVSRKIQNIDGDYYLAIRGFDTTYYNLYITDLDIKIMTITEEFPGVCQCEKEGDFCYFRYENIINTDISLLMKQDLVFYFEFTYGSAQIYANLYETGNNGFILNNLPKSYSKDYKSNFGDQYLKISLKPGDAKYTLDSVLVLGTKCGAKSLFDFNVRPLWKSGDILKNDLGVVFLSLNKDNVFYISQLSQSSIKLVYYYFDNKPLYFEAKALSGSAEVHCYTSSEERLWDKTDSNDKNKEEGYKHISRFSVDEKDSLPFFEAVAPNDGFAKNLVFEVIAKKDCLFSIYLHYKEEFLKIPVSKQIQGKLSEGKFYGYIELLQEYQEIIISIDKMHSESKFTIYAKTSIVNNTDSGTKKNIHLPSNNNYDVKATTNTFNPSVSIKIKNDFGELYAKNKKMITILFVEADNFKTYEDRLNIIAYPSVGHYELVYPQPNKYIYNSLSHLKEDQTVFILKRQDPADNLLVVEISSCQGNYGFRLFNNLNDSKLVRDNDVYAKGSHGKKILVKKIGRTNEYYLSVYGLKEDEIVFDTKQNSSGIDFLMYYYTTTEENYAKIISESKIDYQVESPGNIVLTLPDLVTINSKNNKNKLDDLTLSVIITENEKEFNYMKSICFLSKKYEYIMSNNLYQNYTIKIDKSKNHIEIEKLNKKTNYYINVLITNRKTGQIFAMDPFEVIPNKFFTTNILLIIIVISIVILSLVIFYFYRKYRITKAIINFENSDIKKMGSIPKSISELKKIQEEKNKKAKEKYNSLTEDSGEI